MISSPVIDSRSVLNGVRAASNGRQLRIAMLSIHSNPLGELGTEDTGGMSVYVRELSRELGIAGHNVDIFTCADNGRLDSEAFLSERVRLIHLRVGNNGRVAKNRLFGYLPEVFLSLEKYVSANRLSYDLVHSHYWLSGAVGRRVQERWYVPHVVMFHTTGIAKRVACGQEREPALRLINEKRLAHSSNRILAATERERNLLVRYYGVTGEKIGIVPCGVNLERFQPVSQRLARKELGLEDSRFIVLYVGRFAPVKGLDRLMAAAAHLRALPGVTFLVVGGDGQEEDSTVALRRFAQKASVEGMVRFQGRIEHDLLPLYYSAADVLVVPSYYESFGLVALESLACGTPVISARVGAMETLIASGGTGLLVDTPSPRSFASAIEQLLSDSMNGGMSRERIRASVLGYGWANVASAVAREYGAFSPPCVRGEYGPAMQ
ncbi:MAG TPA: glycosyltransferase [Thermodesulfovibrionales bacterium]|nr:glycosyltransferase [Thermodesulfovibrionales bacterium]